MKNFEVDNAEISQIDDNFYIIPKSKSFKLIYPIKGHSTVKFEFEIFVIILVLSCLTVFKLVDYLADFKTLQNKSRIEILFLMLFFTMLFLPMSYISQDEISKNENRTLAKWKPLILSDGRINYNFGKDYDKWYNDRFNLRNFLLNLNNSLEKTLTRNFYWKNGLVLNKRNNWLGRVNKKGLLNDKDLFSQAELDKALANVERIKEFCDKNNIKLYILAASFKEEIYSDEILGIKDYNRYEKALQMQKYLENTNVPIILAYPKLKTLSQKEYAYFKTDHHWTDSGAYEGYLLLMNQIKKDFLNIYINKPSDFEYYYSNKVRVSPNDFYEGRTYKSMNLNDESILDTSYKYFKHKNTNEISLNTVDCEDGCWERTYKYNQNYPNVYLYGDSFTLNLLPIIPFSFNKTKNIYIPSHQKNSNLKLFEEDIKGMKPDILVLCFQSIERLGFLYKGEK